MDAQIIGDRYEILGLIGVGGMGSVYKARDRELDEVVALKILRRELVDTPGMLARFRQEVKLARRVTHPNVARTFDIGQEGGAKFLTMELVDGESLASRLARGRLGLQAISDLVTPICAGLAAAHAAGVVHRDLKPDNVLLARDGRVLITDFGIARAFGPSAQKTLGVPVGTPAYMAPEQVEGATDVDARADIYALGVMLFELLTGELPWTGENVFGIAAARLLRPPPDPREKNAEIPDALARLVLRCMGRIPAERPASVMEIADAMAALTLPAALVAPTPPTLPKVSFAPPPREAKAVAVLPLKNSGPAEGDYLVDGLTDDLIDTLSMVRGLRVRSRGGVSHLLGSNRDPQEIGRELGVQVIVEGSVQKIADTVRIRARALGVDDGFQLWAQRFECAASEVLSVGERVARAVAEALAVEPATAVGGSAMDAEAVELYLRARHEYQSSVGPSSPSGRKTFERALERAPDNPFVLAGYALATMKELGYGPAGVSEFERAREIAERAVRAAPRLAQTRIALARAHWELGDAPAAAREILAAAGSGQEDGEVHMLWGRMLAECDATELALEHLERALRLEPRLHTPRMDIARIHELAGNREAADEVIGFGRGKLPDAGHPYWPVYVRLLMWRRDTEASERCLAHLRAGVAAGTPLPSMTGAPDLLQAIVDPAQRAALLERTLSRPTGEKRAPHREAFLCQVTAEALAFQDDREGCINTVERADRSLLLDLAWIARCPLLDAVRTDPRVARVRESVAARASGVVAILGR